MTDDGRQWYPIEEAAQLLGMHPETLRRWCRESVLKKDKDYKQYGPYGRYMIARKVVFASK